MIDRDQTTLCALARPWLVNGGLWTQALGPRTLDFSKPSSGYLNKKWFMEWLRPYRLRKGGVWSVVMNRPQQSGIHFGFC